MTGIMIKEFFLALKFFLVGKFGKYFFGCLDLGKFFFKHLKQS